MGKTITLLNHLLINGEVPYRRGPLLQHSVDHPLADLIEIDAPECQICPRPARLGFAIDCAQPASCFQLRHDTLQAQEHDLATSPMGPRKDGRRTLLSESSVGHMDTGNKHAARYFVVLSMKLLVLLETGEHFASAMKPRFRFCVARAAIACLLCAEPDAVWMMRFMEYLRINRRRLSCMTPPGSRAVRFSLGHRPTGQSLE